jgi:hypothetical protein
MQVLPSLQSFCIYAALGILALYFLQAVFFTACLCLDLKRQVGEHRNSKHTHLFDLVKSVSSCHPGD